MIRFSTTFRKQEQAETWKAFAADESLINVPFQAIAEAREEATLNAVFKATKLVGTNATVRHALPIEAALERLRQAGRIS